MKRCAIFAGGDILDDKAVRGLVLPGDFVVCADSGYAHCERLGLAPDLLVGDFDSIGHIPEHVQRLRYAAEKDYTDTALAVEWALGQGYTDLLLAGMTGGKRFDHSLANLQTMAGAARAGAACRMTDGVTDIYALYSEGEPVRFELSPRGGAFSLFSFSESCREVTIEGAKYPLVRYPLRFDEARAVSNEFLGGSAVISFSGGLLLICVGPA